MLRPGRNGGRGGGGLPSYDGMTGGSAGSSASGHYYSSYNNGGGSYGGYQPQSNGGGGGGSGSSGAAYGGYGGYTQPQHGGGSGSSSGYKDKPYRRGSSYGADQVLTWTVQQLKQPISWITLLAALFFVFMLQYRGQCNWILQELRLTSMQDVIDNYMATERRNNNCQRDLGQKQATERRLKDQMTFYERENQKLLREKNELLVKKDSHMANKERDAEQIDRLAARDEAWKEQVMLLQKSTQRESKRAAKEKFGPGPHHVKFSVLLPTDESETERSFVVEMASLDVMPHAVHLFLEQVAHGLWDNAWFYLNGPHVLQAGPQVEEEEEEAYNSNDGSGSSSSSSAADERSLALKPFIDLELDALAFPEYSHKHPHNKWTLGFTGRPGGPDFYINKMSNTEAHGPGGQHQHDLEEYADACFATVVEGYDVLDMIFKEPTYPDDHEWGWFYEEPVHIVGARVMETPPPIPTKVSTSSSSEEGSRRKPKKPLGKHKIDHQVIP